MLIKIHDLPTRYPMEGVSFHAIPEARGDSWLDRIWWDGEVLEIVTTSGDVWRLDFETHSWSLTESVGVVS